MSHFGRSGPPDISDTYYLLILNISFRTTADDLFPLFDKYGKVVDIFIPKDRRTGESRGFAFVRYKYADEAEKAVDRLDGREVDGREITVQFAKYGPNAERIHRGRVIEKSPRARGRSRSHTMIIIIGTGTGSTGEKGMMMIVGKGVITGIMEEAGVVAIPLTITTEAMLMMSISEGVTLLKGVSDR
uniref:RRM domain-containing protein n=1 Tax=Lactuca sativa TaxID=4236 RepID=A0A9R1XD55_LACSA|nr:hypothetical protein LSAT_V11C500267530 [Lactuca sativa]